MNMQTSIFLIVCALLLGIAIGGFVASISQGKKRDETIQESMPGDLIRMRKDLNTDTLEVMVDGQAFRSADEMNTTQRTLAGYAIRDLQVWLSTQSATEQPAEIPIPAEPAPVTTAPEAGAPSTMAPSSADVIASASIVAQPVVFTSELEEDAERVVGAVDDTKKRKRGGLIGVITRALSADAPSVRPVTKSIAVQVNEILQKKLKDTPLESRGICLLELPGQDMVVMIGLEKYDSVSAVPDDEIRAVIQLAVNEWLVKSAT